MFCVDLIHTRKEISHPSLLDKRNTPQTSTSVKNCLYTLEESFPGEPFEDIATGSDDHAHDYIETPLMLSIREKCICGRAME